MNRRLWPVIAVLVWLFSTVGSVQAQQPLMPTDVVEAMRSCLSITSVTAVQEWRASSGTQVKVEGAPTFAVTDYGSVSGRPEKYNLTEQFYLWRDDSGPNAEYYAHVVDPKIILFFPRYRGAQEIGAPDLARIREFRARVLDCFDSSTGLTPNEVTAVRWYDKLYYTRPPEGSLPISGFPKPIFLPANGSSLLSGRSLIDASITSDSRKGLGYQVTFAATPTDVIGDLSLSGTFGRQLEALATGNDCMVVGPNYCAFQPMYAQSTRSTGEMFSGLSVGDEEAVVNHVTCCDGGFWKVTWYDSGRDLTYSLDLTYPLWNQAGLPNTIDAANVNGAQKLADTAAALIPVDMSALRGRTPPRLPQ